MKVKHLFWIFFSAGLLFLAMQVANAQQTTEKPKVKTETTKIITESVSAEPENRVETLSGINLFPNRKTGSFNLRFSQTLKDTANMELKTDAGKVLYALALAPEQAPMTKPVDVGKLDAGIYLIEVKSANTVYWKKVRIRK